jgi:hypothetical protein
MLQNALVKSSACQLRQPSLAFVRFKRQGCRCLICAQAPLPGLQTAGWFAFALPCGALPLVPFPLYPDASSSLCFVLLNDRLFLQCLDKSVCLLTF